MSTFIALVKGLNVGGHKKVSMAELRQLLTKEGLLNVHTYIQSGNVIFQASDIKELMTDKIQFIIISDLRCLSL